MSSCAQAASSAVQQVQPRCSPEIDAMLNPQGKRTPEKQGILAPSPGTAQKILSQMVDDRFEAGDVARLNKAPSKRDLKGAQAEEIDTHALKGTETLYRTGNGAYIENNTSDGVEWYKLKNPLVLNF